MVNVNAVALALKSLGLPRKQPSKEEFCSSLSSGELEEPEVGEKTETELPHQWLSGECDQVTQILSPWVSTLFPLSVHLWFLQRSLLAVSKVSKLLCLLEESTSFCSSMKEGQSQEMEQRRGRPSSPEGICPGSWDPSQSGHWSFQNPHHHISNTGNIDLELNLEKNPPSNSTKPCKQLPPALFPTPSDAIAYHTWAQWCRFCFFNTPGSFLPSWKPSPLLGSLCCIHQLAPQALHGNLIVFSSESSPRPPFLQQISPTAHSLTC